MTLSDPHDELQIAAGRHPLLLAQGISVVPFDLVLGEAERTFLISGPNTGGKTVLLKTIALLSLSAQAGIPATVGDGTRLPVYDEVFADIGDEQSIEASLSTFSAHVRNLREILNGANDRSLVLIDELGSGTDPVEGAALGGAVLESLTARGARTIATTHLGALKELAVENRAIVNGSLQFDAAALAPTYRLIKGIPGQSYGLSIARRLGVPDDVLECAERRLPTGERDVNALLMDLEARETALTEREREAAAIAEDARERARRVAERERNAGVRERESERRARQESRRYLLAARREIESTIKALKHSTDVDEAARDARKHVEELAKSQTEALERLDARERGARPGHDRAREAPAVGDHVAVDSLGGRVGQLMEIRDGERNRSRRNAQARASDDRAHTRSGATTAVCRADSRGRPGDPRRERDRSSRHACERRRRHRDACGRQRRARGPQGAANNSRKGNRCAARARGRDAQEGAARHELPARRVERRWCRCDDSGAVVSSDPIVERVREAADIVKIIGEHVKLKRAGGDYRGPCPFHGGKNPNFSVSPRRGQYHCFKCGESGDVFSFLQKQLGLSFPDALREVAGTVGIEVPSQRVERSGPDPREPFWEMNAAAADYFTRVLWTEERGAAARTYLDGRGIREDDARRFELGFAPDDIATFRNHMATLGFDVERLLDGGLLSRRDENSEPRPRFRNRLMFPILDASGRHIAFGGRALGDFEPKYLNSPETPVFSKSHTLYALSWCKNGIRKNDRAFVVEGYMDAIRLMQAGIDAVVAPLGTALTEAQAELLARYTKNVFLVYDSDQAGLKATFRAGDELLRHGFAVRVVTLEEGEDPDTFVRANGADALEQHAASAVDVFERKVQILERGGWFIELQKRRRALDRLLPTIRATRDPLLRDIYISRAAEKTGVAKDVLLREVEGRSGEQGVTAPARPQPRGVHPPRRSERRSDHTSRGSAAERELVRAVLDDPARAPAIAEKVDPTQFSDAHYRAIFRALLTLGEDFTIERLAEMLDAVDVEVLNAILEEHQVQLDPERTIAASINAMAMRAIDARLAEIDTLMTLATDEEQTELTREKMRLQKETQGLSSRSSQSVAKLLGGLRRTPQR